MERVVSFLGIDNTRFCFFLFSVKMCQTSINPYASESNLLIGFHSKRYIILVHLDID
jgi:hypothetical protein